jgi:hypothetical protein
MSDFTKLIDRRLEIKLHIERLTEELAGIDEEIKESCEVGEVLLGSDGYGYRLSAQEKLNYGSPAIELLEKRGLLKEFVSISSAKLEGLCKKGFLPWADYDLLKSSATVKQTVMITKYIPEESKVF